MSALLDYDTGPLNWVRGEIDAALQAALGRVQAFSVDADLTNAMRLARDDAHQVGGVLRMVGLEGAATLAGALETSLADIDENRQPASDELMRALRNAIEGLQRWVKDLADGRGSGELALFPLYKRLRELQGAERVFEGELFFPDLRTRVSANDAAASGLSQEELSARVKRLRAQFQRGLLAFLRNADAERGLGQMRDALAQIERIAPSQAAHTFWWACVGFVDSLIARGVEADFHVKQLLARVDMQMRRLVEGSPQVAERLLRDALFFVAKSKPTEGCAADVRATFGLDRYLPGRGLLDPETMARMRPVLDALHNGLKAARDHWHAYVDGDAAQLDAFQAQLGRMQPQAQTFEHSGLMPLLQELATAASAAVGRDGGGREQLDLEVASTLLFIQNAVEKEDVLHDDFAARAENQQARLRALVEGSEMPASLIETSTQRDAERDMLLHMAQEVGQNLRQMEEALDAFFRDTGDREGLAALPNLAQQAQGALTMLELPAAANLLQAATASAAPFISEGEPDDATRQRLADAFSSLGLYIESYCAGRGDAGNMLRPVLAEFGLIGAHEPENPLGETVEAGIPARKAEVRDAYLGWDEAPGEAAKKKFLDTLGELNRDAELIDDLQLKRQSHALLDACRELDAPGAEQDALLAVLTGASLPARPQAAPVVDIPPVAADASVLEDVAEAPAEAQAEEIVFAAIEVPVEAVPAEAPPAAPADPGVLATLPEDVETELLEVFLEEAGEVLATQGEAVVASRENPEDQNLLTTIRRGFHTLKGSGRMVGLNELGEVAWSLEQMMNARLAEKLPASADLLELVGMARALFHDWVDALRTATPVSLPVPALLAAVACVAEGRSLASCLQPVAPAPVAEPPVEHAAEPVADYVAIIEVARPHAGTEIEAPVAVPAAFPEPAPAEAALPQAPVAASLELAEPVVEAVEDAGAVAAPRFGALIEVAVPPAPAPDEAPVPVDDICIGTVCLSSGLYDIFMAEAQQRLAVLREEAERHAAVGHSTIAEHARRAVHTLAGIAGTAGIVPLADLSLALERYWNRFAHVPLPAAHLALVQDTVLRVQEMVDAIGRAELPEHAADLIVALGELEDEQPAEPATLLAEAAPAAPAEMPTEVVEADAGADTPAASESIIPDVSAFVPEVRSVAPTPVFERREIADEIDEQLLPVFLEEAETLVPDGSVQLREWKAAPDDGAARNALQRTLHTIKGSARMVGAMRLGELTHVMETRVIAAAEGQLAPDAHLFDTLESQYDRLVDVVERLHQGDLAPVADEPDAPLAAPVEPVLAEEADGPRAAVVAALPAGDTPRAPTPPASRDSNALTLRVRADWVDRMVNQAGEVAIARSRIESEVFAFKRHVHELSEALVRLRGHIREVEIQAESQMQATFQAQGAAEQFDPLEFDRFTRFQEVTRFLAESVNDISTVQHILLARLGEADAALIQQTRLNRELQQDLLRVRMVPLYSVAERLYRTVRQTARDVGKRAQLDIQGGELEIDRSVLEKVTAPIEHLLRNALAHGVETPDVRRAAGKAEFGEIVLSARQSGNEMLITVKDDGAGLNYARIREKAEANGLLPSGVEVTESLLAQMIFAAGFSTAESVTQVAGRGVGMDVVKSEISALGGRIDIGSAPGQGTAFSIYLPLTLAMTQAVMVQAARHDYALPAPLVQQVLELKPAELEQAMAAGAVSWRGMHYPFAYLPHLLGDTEAVHEVQRYNAVVLLASGASHAAVLVDGIEGTREIVVKNIGPQMARITGVAGATVRGDGRVILILNPVPLVLRWARQPRVAMEQAAPTEAVEVSSALQPPLVLVVDDSLTVRKITTRLLTREGFRVDSAKDGVDALERMHDLVPDIVLLDVEMPRMDGFELARVMRSDAQLKSVPIIMITSRTADKHRNHAFEIGVNVYLGKPYQEQQLLDHIAEQLGQSEMAPA
jgi:chemosensory pili system protein ChpA (sensor histidine kinase/response regulator)